MDGTLSIRLYCLCHGPVLLQIFNSCGNKAFTIKRNTWSTKCCFHTKTLNLVFNIFVLAKSAAGADFYNSTAQWASIQLLMFFGMPLAHERRAGKAWTKVRAEKFKWLANGQSSALPCCGLQACTFLSEVEKHKSHIQSLSELSKARSSKWEAALNEKKDCNTDFRCWKRKNKALVLEKVMIRECCRTEEGTVGNSRGACMEA